MKRILVCTILLLGLWTSGAGAEDYYLVGRATSSFDFTGWAYCDNSSRAYYYNGTLVFSEGPECGSGTTTFPVDFRRKPTKEQFQNWAKQGFICEAIGHRWGLEWWERSKIGLREYKRTCTICGKVETLVERWE